ncbi:peroxisomal coenzyme A diphosphatase NUDT7-like isoform X1 [Gigantopelta aegis]|uniref:peroxisomal coenzyme A diphosphatase NUDT7-like isoform X1 n=1 Tax=Gigantopelta aegis TaxID=1735272 RepID=UPI001B88C6A8|nr:peroxisomal coenzyme A diphosphatase NUDT7-like isoform X1 [Gigantopelta aegis]XP_041376077.1 peroxisomal coenzyme A diphosphatase NUDT7-like isoform X1 [Gigantopelta aegis]
MSELCTVEDVDSIREKFQQYDIRGNIRVDYPHTLYPHLKRSSVLVPIFFKTGQWRVLLTIRSRKLKNHTGSVAFPGGVSDQSDADEVSTALREAEEEVGLLRQDVKVVAVLHPCFVAPGNVVFPVVGVINRDFVPKLNSDEVEAVFDLPLEQFLHGSNKSHTWNPFGHEIHVYVFPCVVGDKHVDVWGFTAVVCVSVAYVLFNVKKRARILTQSNEADDDIFGDFVFTFHHLCQNMKARL